MRTEVLRDVVALDVDDGERASLAGAGRVITAEALGAVVEETDASTSA